MKKKIRNWQTIENPEIWDKLRPPLRPSKDDLKGYLYYFKKIKPRKVLILGATPELRDLCAGLKIRTFIMDFSIGMLMTMSKLLKIADIAREVWIKSNWLDEISLFCVFDIIVGDLAKWHIPVSLQDKFLNRMLGMLKPGGYLILRVHFPNEKLMGTDPEKMVKSVFKNRSNKSSEEIEDLITSRLHDINTDIKHHRIRKKQCTRAINNYLSHNRLKEKETSVLKNILYKTRNSIVWTQRSRDEIEDLFKKHFEIKYKRISGDYDDAPYYPIYLLKKKQVL